MNVLCACVCERGVTLGLCLRMVGGGGGLSLEECASMSGNIKDRSQSKYLHFESGALFDHRPAAL